MSTRERIVRKKPSVVFGGMDRIVVFRYADVPDEWHATSVGTSASGAGPTPEAAVECLMKSIGGLFEETLQHGWAGVFGVGADPEWVRAYEDGKHPTDESIVIVFRGAAAFHIDFSAKKARAALDGPVRYEPFPASARLQSA